jgi:hypothetical protein
MVVAAHGSKRHDFIDFPHYFFRRTANFDRIFRNEIDLCPRAEGLVIGRSFKAFNVCRIEDFSVYLHQSHALTVLLHSAVQFWPYSESRHVYIHLNFCLLFVAGGARLPSIDEVDKRVVDAGEWRSWVLDEGSGSGVLHRGLN